jgi:hypothetical protein
MYASYKYIYLQMKMKQFFKISFKENVSKPPKSPNRRKG